MRTDYDLVNALVAMYQFLGGDRCMSWSNTRPNPAFRCGFTKNDLLVNAIITAATSKDKNVVCEYSGNVVNIEVKF